MARQAFLTGRKLPQQARDFQEIPQDQNTNQKHLAPAEKKFSSPLKKIADNYKRAKLGYMAGWLTSLELFTAGVFEGKGTFRREFSINIQLQRELSCTLFRKTTELSTVAKN